jgi:hypothetical protein
MGKAKDWTWRLLPAFIVAAIIETASLTSTVRMHKRIQASDEINAVNVGGIPEKMSSRSLHSNVSPAPNPTNETGIKEGKELYAYMFLIGGIHEDRPGYRGFLYNVLAAANILQEQGSKADLWLYLQFSPDSKRDTLPEQELRVLADMGIEIVYLEKPERDSFTGTMFEKFHILRMTQYRRVIYLDADVLPLMNMDYLFELSDGENPVIKPNFVIATRGEPANGGCFMLEPREGAYEELQEIIRKQRESARHLKFPHFHRTKGWGHSFKEHGDEWTSIYQSGKRWNFYGAHVDQGLLLFLVRYHIGTYTAFLGGRLVNYQKGEEGQPEQESEMNSTSLEQYMPKKRLSYQFGCDKNADPPHCRPPYCSFAHFVGSQKPWQVGFTKGVPDRRRRSMLGPYRLFYEMLFKLSERLGLGITEENVNKKFGDMKESPLGYTPSLRDHAHQVQNQKTNPQAETQRL